MALICLSVFVVIGFAASSMAVKEIVQANNETNHELVRDQEAQIAALRNKIVELNKQLATQEEQKDDIAMIFAACSQWVKNECPLQVQRLSCDK